MRSIVVRSALFFGLFAPPLAAQELITNGGFESGLTGWSNFGQIGGLPVLRFSSMSSGASSPISGQGPYLSRSGGSHAIGDQSGPGSGALYQSFTIGAAATTATLRFSLFARNFASTTTIGSNLSYTGAANQHARVDILAGNLAADPLGVGASVLGNFYIGADVVRGASAPWIDYTFDVSSLLSSAGTYTLRFAQVDNQSFFNTGIDDVSLIVSTVPEPATLALLSVGLGLIGVRIARRRQA